MAGKQSKSLVIHQKRVASPSLFSQKPFRNPYLLITYIFILLFICLKLLSVPLPIPYTQQPSTKTTVFQVQGTGTISTLPNSVQLSFSIEKTASSILEAQNQTTNALKTITENLKSAGISTKNISTVNYSVFPQYNIDPNGKQIPNGFTVTQDLRVIASPPDKTNSIIDIATQNGATQIGGIAFTIDSETQKNLEDKARKDAVNSAKQKAQTLAKASGMQLGRIVNIKETESSKSQPINFTSNGINTDTTQIVNQAPTDGNSITISVTLSYETY